MFGLFIPVGNRQENLTAMTLRVMDDLVQRPETGAQTVTVFSVLAPQDLNMD